MANEIIIGGWNIKIAAEHKVGSVDPNGFKFSKLFCIGHTCWNAQPVYFMLGGATRSHLKDFATIEDMREEYRNHMADGWHAF